MEIPNERGTPVQGNTPKKGDSELGWTAYCDKCGNAFNSRDVVKEHYNEYGEGLINYEKVSQCCGADYSDRPLELGEQ